MEIKKKKQTFNTYVCEISFGQLVAIKNAMAKEHSDPLADELYSELTWYLDNVPGPGESEEDIKKEEEAAETGLASPEAEGQPLKANADELVPSPGEEGAGSSEDRLPPGWVTGARTGQMGGKIGDEGPEGPEEGPQEPQNDDSEVDRRLPPPPAD